MTKQLEVHDLRAYFNKNEALKGISMDILQNEVTAIIGPSGCGKSTFIRCLNRMHETIKGATITGEIMLENENIFEKDPVELRRYIGMVFQKPNPFVKLSVYDNVASGLRLDGGYSKADIEVQVEKSLQMVALWDEVKDRLHTNAMGLSGGQQQRLCMARTLAIEPRVILMDEPTSALDPISTHKIEELMQDLKTNYCIVIVTHNMQQASRISDKTAFFLSGNLVEFDKTANIFSNPKEQKTEEYISGRFG